MAEQYTHRGIGFFKQEKNAEQAMRSLNSADFSMNQVSILAKQLQEDVVAGGARTGYQVEGQDINDSKRIPESATAGAFWGGLLGGLSSLMIPGLGAVIAVGSVGAALTAVVAGQGAGAMATRNLQVGLKSLGIPEDQAGDFSDRLINGEFMVIVDGDQGELNQVESIFKNHDIQDWAVYTDSH